jgi:hypothetical protein
MIYNCAAPDQMDVECFLDPQLESNHFDDDVLTMTEVESLYFHSDGLDHYPEDWIPNSIFGRYSLSKRQEEDSMLEMSLFLNDALFDEAPPASAQPRSPLKRRSATTDSTIGVNSWWYKPIQRSFTNAARAFQTMYPSDAVLHSGEIQVEYETPAVYPVDQDEYRAYLHTSKELQDDFDGDIETAIITPVDKFRVLDKFGALDEFDVLELFPEYSPFHREPAIMKTHKKISIQRASRPKKYKNALKKIKSVKILRIPSKSKTKRDRPNTAPQQHNVKVKVSHVKVPFRIPLFSAQNKNRNGFYNHSKTNVFHGVLHDVSIHNQENIFVNDSLSDEQC